MMIYIGIDPGVVNLGIALTDAEGKLVKSYVVDTRLAGGITPTVNSVIEDSLTFDPKILTIERYVPYAGKQTTTGEDILMLIGALIYGFENKNIAVNVYRAIDWKPSLCKYLVKTKKFNNPSSNFDKRYSKAAAECITGVKVKTDHEADAICLSYMWKVKEAG